MYMYQIEYTNITTKINICFSCFRLGVASKDECEDILEANCWELERSASALLDKFA